MSQDKKLGSPPLVEALFEVKWELEEIAPGVLRDPGFDVAHYRFFESFQKEFPEVEPLDTLKIPNDLTPHLVKYRYRVSKGKWPLVQLGPGVASLNFTQPYDWDSFLVYAKKLIPNLKKAYEGFDLRLSSITLRYINAEPFDFEAEDLLEFMANKLNTEFRPPIETNNQYSDKIMEGNWSLQYNLREPKGTGILRFSTAHKDDTKSIVWEQNVLSTGTRVPQPDDGDNTELVTWLCQAHDVIEDWFLKIVAGDLLRKYQGEEQ